MQLVSTIITAVILLSIQPAVAKVVNANGDPISPDEIPELEKNALEGDGKAANRLAFNTGRSGKHDYMYWLTVGAEDGDIVDMYNLGVFLKDSEDPEQRLRAAYWLKLAGAHDYKPAEYELRELERKDNPSLPSLPVPNDLLPLPKGTQPNK